MKKLLLLITHGIAIAIGFAAGIYALPILTAPEAPKAEAVAAASKNATFTGEFKKELKDSDFLHWGEGKVSISKTAITLMGKVAPGPDYHLYLSPEFVETEADFERLKDQMVNVGMVKTFENFIVDVPAEIDPSKYKAVIVWCESFGEFITAAAYQ